VISDRFRQECHTESRQQCKTVTRQECQTFQKAVMTTVPEQRCTDHLEDVCQSVPRNQCNTVQDKVDRQVKIILIFFFLSLEVLMRGYFEQFFPLKYLSFLKLRLFFFLLVQLKISRFIVAFYSNCSVYNFTTFLLFLPSL
jgi:hypothetical protein